MIVFKSLYKKTPFLIFNEKYCAALDAGQKNIEAIVIASYNKENKEVDSRFVNLKFIDGNQFIFFTNYNSPKSISFSTHSQISALLYWSSTNVQIRMKASINKSSLQFNQKYFKDRSFDKNALAISSNQSKPIESYSQVKKNYKQSLESADLKKCPEYWGGYSFTPYYFEFWVGHQSRLNKRDVYELNGEDWIHSILQP